MNADLSRRWCAAAQAVTISLAAAGCARTPAYVPRTRELTITTVPLLVKEARRLYPFLDQAFAPGGVLDGKEVYAFSPATLTVVEGDTIVFTFINPEDDLHSFVLPDLAVPLPGESITHATYVARRSGIFPFVCNIASHLPMMSGQLVVLPAASMAGSKAQDGGGTDASTPDH
jgi:hypothetical protein